VLAHAHFLTAVQNVQACQHTVRVPGKLWTQTRRGSEEMPRATGRHCCEHKPSNSDAISQLHERGVQAHVRKTYPQDFFPTVSIVSFTRAHLPDSTRHRSVWLLWEPPHEADDGAALVDGAELRRFRVKSSSRELFSFSINVAIPCDRSLPTLSVGHAGVVSS
jgi:hypothetical protein